MVIINFKGGNCEEIDKFVQEKLAKIFDFVYCCKTEIEFNEIIYCVQVEEANGFTLGQNLENNFKKIIERINNCSDSLKEI